MEKTKEGYFITNDEVNKALRYAGYAGAGLIVLNIVRALLWVPVIKVIND